MQDSSIYRIIRDLPLGQIEAWGKERTTPSRPPQETKATLATRKDVGILHPGTPAPIHQQILAVLQNQ